MEKIISICATWLDQKEYKKILMSILILFSLIGPSMSIIFLYKRNLFFELDIFKLIIICLILNTMIFIILFILFNIYMELENKLIEMKISFELNKLNFKIKNYINDEVDLKLIDLEKKYSDKLFDIENNNTTIIGTSLYTIFYIAGIWVIYAYNTLFNNISKYHYMLIVANVVIAPLMSIVLITLLTLILIKFKFMILKLYLYIKNFLVQKITVKFLMYIVSSFLLYIVLKLWY